MNKTGQIGTFESERWGAVKVWRDAYTIDNSLAITLTVWNRDPGLDAPLATLSVHTDASANLPPNCFYAKEWSENEELAAEALESGLFRVREDLPPVITGYTSADVWEVVT